MTVYYRTQCYKCGAELEDFPPLIEMMGQSNDWIENYLKENNVIRVYQNDKEYLYKSHKCNPIKKFFHKKIYNSQNEVPIKREIMSYTHIVFKGNENDTL